MPQLLLGDLDLLADPYEAKVGSSWGNWQAVTSTTESLYVDGSVVYGDTTDNRTVSLQVYVEASSRVALVTACEALFAEANKASNELVFLPDDGAPVVYEVFRAQPERTDDQSEAWNRRSYTFTFSAKPFTRAKAAVTVAAAAPGVVLAAFESATTGVDLFTPPRASGGAWSKFTGGSAPLATLFSGVPAAVTAVTNCTASIGVYGGYNGVQVTAASNGLAEAADAASYAVSGAVVAISVGGLFATSPYPHYQAGIEWLNSSGAVIGVDWSDAEVTAPGNGTRGYGPYFAAPRPAAATKARIRVRVTDATAGTKYTFNEFTIADVAAYTLPTTGTIPVGSSNMSVAHDGTGGLSMTLTGGKGFAWFALPAPVSLADKAAVSVWVLAGTSGAASEITLYDSAGRWSRWALAYASPAPWLNASVDLSSTPLGTSSNGPVDLSTVSAIGLTARSNVSASIAFDTVMAGPKDTVLTTQHGSVVQLAIEGSARSTVAMAISNATTPMTDLLLAAADAAVSPLVPVASSVATASAPAAYDGTYRVIASIVPAAAKTSPTCVVSQLIGGVSAATQTLTGTMATGNRYCDFGTVALPLVGFPADNQSVSYTFTLGPTDAAWSEVLLLDVDQPMVWLPNLSTARPYVWVDEPDPTAQLGRVWVGSAADRSDARTPTTPPDLSRPFQVQAPFTRILAFSTSGTPGVLLTSFPRYLVEPT